MSICVSACVSLSPPAVAQQRPLGARPLIVLARQCQHAQYSSCLQAGSRQCQHQRMTISMLS